jgi:sugar transferase (PEP-CTERM/EpsH1 system associated)
MIVRTESEQRGPAAGPSTFRVAHVVLNLDIGGLERVVINLIRDADTSRFWRTLYCLGDGGDLIDEVHAAGCAVRTFHKREGLAYGLPVKMARRLREDRIDIVHCHDFPALVYGAPAGRMSRVHGVVYTPHGIDSSNRKQLSMFRRFGLIDRLVAVSEDARRVSVATGQFDPERTTTILNGVDVDHFERPIDGAKLRRELGIDDDALVVGMVARLAPVKDHANLLRAFLQVRDAGHNVTLLIVGDGELHADLVARAKEMGIADAVMFLGARDDVDELLQVMDLFVLSSQSEGISITLLEAMAAGLAIVATDVGGNSEVIEEGATGLLVPKEDPKALAATIAALLTDGDRRRAMGEAGRERVRGVFSVAEMTRRYEAVYEEVLNQ